MLGFAGVAEGLGVSVDDTVGVDSARGLTVISSDIRVRGGCGYSQSLNVEPWHPPEAMPRPVKLTEWWEFSAQL